MADPQAAIMNGLPPAGASPMMTAGIRPNMNAGFGTPQPGMGLASLAPTPPPVPGAANAAGPRAAPQNAALANAATPGGVPALASALTPPQNPIGAAPGAMRSPMLADIGALMRAQQQQQGGFY